MGVVAVLVLLAIALAWFFWPTQSAPRPSRRERPDVDASELDAAERDVQEAPNEETVRDWGPGTGQKPLP